MCNPYSHCCKFGVSTRLSLPTNLGDNAGRGAVIDRDTVYKIGDNTRSRVRAIQAAWGKVEISDLLYQRPDRIPIT